MKGQFVLTKQLVEGDRFGLFVGIFRSTGTRYGRILLAVFEVAVAVVSIVDSAAGAADRTTVHRASVVYL